MMNNAAFLDALIVSTPDNCPVANQNGPDRDSAGASSYASFFDCSLEKFFHHIII